jgi:hypothetical protein
MSANQRKHKHKSQRTTWRKDVCVRPEAVMEVREFAEFGRAAVAVRDMPPAQVILTEAPLVSWPSSTQASALAPAIALAVEHTNRHFQSEPAVQAIHTGRALVQESSVVSWRLRPVFSIADAALGVTVLLASDAPTLARIREMAVPNLGDEQTSLSLQAYPFLASLLHQLPELQHIDEAVCVFRLLH